MTNREWLNSLSNEAFLDAVDDNGRTICQFIDHGCDGEENCTACKLRWLNEEHKEINNE